MITTIAEAENERYGNRRGIAGKGEPYDIRRCVMGVWNGWHHSQCSRKAKHGPSELYCKQHDPVAKAEKWDAQRANDRRLRDEHLARIQKDRDIEVAKAACVIALRSLYPECAAIKALDNALNREL